MVKTELVYVILWMFFLVSCADEITVQVNSTTPVVSAQSQTIEPTSIATSTSTVTATLTATSTSTMTAIPTASSTSTVTATPIASSTPNATNTPRASTTKTGNTSSRDSTILSAREIQTYASKIRQNPSICVHAVGKLAVVCDMDGDRPVQGGRTHGSPSPVPAEASNEISGPEVDPDDPPKVATSNFVDLAPYISITRIRAAYGHNYSAGDDEYDPTGQSCRSMKHYFDAYTFEQRWDGNFGSYDTRGNVKFYSPTDGTLMDASSGASDIGIEYEFTISSTASPRVNFVFHHVDLLEDLRSGGEVRSGQHIGYIARFHGQAEIVTYVQMTKKSAEYISFFDVMSEEVFALYQARGITSREQMTISQAQRDANPIACAMGDDKGGKFVTTGDEESFNRWQYGPDNWVYMTD